MIRVLLLLLGRDIIQRHWRKMFLVGLLWLLLGLFILIDAIDGVTIIHPHYFGYFVLPEAVISLLAAAGSQGTARKMRIAQAVALFGVAWLIFSKAPASDFVLAMLLGGGLLVDGGFRIGSAWVVRYPDWRMGMVGGIAEVLLAIGTLQPWPTWYAGTIGVNVGGLMMLASFGIMHLAMRIRRLEDGSSITTLLSRNALHALTDWRWSAHNRKRKRGDVIVHVWTPTGTAMTPLHRRAINRYIAAVDQSGTISTGHAALEMVPDVYISHYPAVEIDRNPNEFTRTLRATPDNNVQGRFLPSYEYESQDWCPSTVQVVIRNADTQRLKAFWKRYRQNDTYNLTNRNCSSAVADALDAAFEGAYRDKRWPFFQATRTLLYPELWAAGLIRQRAEKMAWTPGLVLDYARALSVMVDPQDNWSSLAIFRSIWRHYKWRKEHAAKLKQAAEAVD